MIISNVGDVLKVERGIIVHGCNCRGKMGSGIAKQVKAEYPKVFARYHDDYEAIGLKLGTISFVHVAGEKIIVNAMTQENYGKEPKLYVDYTAVRKCFRLVNEVALVDKLPVHFPLIGCGLAGGDWSIISAIIDDELDDCLEKNVWRLPS
jgi:O-acetyl-ADP-ribose deacetylase (regulator of RNase III)